MSDIADLAAKSFAIAALNSRAVHLRRAALQAEAMKDHAAVAAAMAEIDRIEGATACLGQSRTSPGLDPELLEGPPVAILEAAIEQLEEGE